MVRGEQRGHGDRLVDASELLVDEVVFELDLFVGFRRLADAGHRLDRFHRVLACRRFRRQHDRVGAIEHRIGDVGHFGAGGYGVDDHRLHHLRGGDHHTIHFARHADHAFLQRGHGGIADFHCEVAARHHDAVGGAQNFRQRRNRLDPLDLGDERGLVVVGLAGDVGELPRQLHVGGVFGKGHGQIVGLEGHRGANVLHVLGGEGRGRQTAALLVDALVVRQLAADGDDGVDLFPAHSLDGEHDETVVEQQTVARVHVARQVFVVQAAAGLIADFAGGVEREFLSGLQHDLAVLEPADPNFRALQIGHDGNGLAQAGGCFADELGAVNMVLRLAMRKIEPNDIDPGREHAFEDVWRGTGGADGGNDFGGAGHG